MAKGRSMKYEKAMKATVDIYLAMKGGGGE